MHKSTLREIAKFAAGLVAADFLCGLWIYFSGLAPIYFLGIKFTAQHIILWMIFDAIVFAFLVHFAWKMQDRPRTENERFFHNAVGTIFGIIALLHLSRIIFGIQLNIGSWQVPYWLNGLGTIVTGFLSYASFHLGRKRR